MTLKQRKKLLTCMLLLMLIAFVRVTIWFFQPLSLPPFSLSSSGSASSLNVPTSNSTSLSRSRCEAIWDRDLTKPLFDPKPIVVNTPPPPKPKLTVRLTGTALEPGSTYGFFQTPSGDTKLVEIGQVVEGAKLLSLTADSAVVEYYGDQITLMVEKEGH